MLNRRHTCQCLSFPHTSRAPELGGAESAGSPSLVLRAGRSWSLQLPSLVGFQSWEELESRSYKPSCRALSSDDDGLPGPRGSCSCMPGSFRRALLFILLRDQRSDSARLRMRRLPSFTGQQEHEDVTGFYSNSPLFLLHLTPNSHCAPLSLTLSQRLPVSWRAVSHHSLLCFPTPRPLWLSLSPVVFV